MAKKITELPAAASFEGLVALGVDTTKNESVQIPLQFVKVAADAAVAAATNADTATAEAIAATALAAEVANNPTKVGDDNYVYKYDPQIDEYVKTDIFVKGETATVAAGVVTSLASTEPAFITNVGTDEAAVFNFGIPRGVDGITPIRGTDYWTTADISAVNESSKAYIDEALAATNAVVLSLTTKI